MKEKIPRQKMPVQKAEIRNRNFQEVPLGYKVEAALLEAGRCLNCKKPLCVPSCPVSIDIPGFISKMAEGNWEEAFQILSQKTALAAVCGRVCPQENQCEKTCVLGKKQEAVAIGNLERYIADWARENNIRPQKITVKSNGKKVAVVGSGPAGLTVAGDLILQGYQVTVFEALHQPGGVLVYGIPEFRLPENIVENECENLKKLGVKFELNSLIGRLKTIDELLEEFEAVFIGVGSGMPTMLDIPGENLIGVFSANEYLTRSNLMKAYLFPQYDTPIYKGENVVVLGAGNVAMDAARSALRLGAKSVKIVYRRSQEEMPARKEEIQHALEEGIELFLLTAPTSFIGDENGNLRAMNCIKMELGEPDKSGRRRPIPVANSDFTIKTDLAIVAVGTKANPLISSTVSGLKVNSWGHIIIDEKTGKTTKNRVWAGGDIVTGAATVILAMGAGRIAAQSIQQFLSP